MTAANGESPDRADAPRREAVEDAAAVHLADHLQRRNIAIYAVKWCLFYFAAPVLYIGYVQVGLCKNLGASDFVANLPAAAYFFFAFFPVLAAWAVPQVRYLRRVIVAGHATATIATGVTALLLWLPLRAEVHIAAVIAHGVLAACGFNTSIVFEWELIGRGVSETRRGVMFALAFSVGPVFAVLGSLATQLIINDEIFGWTPGWWTSLPYPYGYIALYALACPLMIIGTLLAMGYAVPLPRVDVERKPFLSGVFGGFGRFISYRYMLIVCIAYLFVYSALMIQNNMMLYTRESTDLSEDAFVGYQLALRFGCKVVGGLALGWLLKMTNPKVNLVATASLLLASIAWILGVRWLLGEGLPFLAAFGLVGAAELLGLYYPYYVVCLSPKSQMRRNSAFLMMLTAVPVGVAPALFGFISDTADLRTSFLVAGAIVGIGLLLVLVGLPAHPRPRAEDLEAADQDAEAE